MKINQLAQAAALATAIACESPEEVAQPELDSVCDQVHQQVLALNALAPTEDAQAQADAEKTRCEALTDDEQKALLKEARLAVMSSSMKMEAMR